MKRLFHSTLFLGLLILMTACPYESQVPITDTDYPVNAQLPGKWYKEGEMDNEYPDEYYLIEQLNDVLLNITKFDLNEDDNSYREESFIAHLSILKDDDGKEYHFLNMKKDGKYLLHRLDLQGDSFVLYEVTDNIDEKFSSSEELYDFVKAYMHLSFFYNRDEEQYFKGDHEK
jgi:hypothetical protein